MMKLISKLTASHEEGQTMAEYAVVLGVITIAVVVTLGTQINTAFTTVSNKL